ncbi:hypothetical protein [Mycobacterium hubeiense]|uniref:hypothetical protein n=1 Tax=Mycobacterium hubeiense TaxID=1867256 RepID=UPI00115B0D75|nr:hypothetical protein [Mycobacterium sp. QGD 101]
MRDGDDLLQALTSIEKSLPQSADAYQSPASGWLAQRIVGAVAVLESVVRPICERERMLGEITAPPALPEGVTAFGGDWIDAAKIWLDAADMMQRCELEPVRTTAQRLREYAATQLT